MHLKFWDYYHEIDFSKKSKRFFDIKNVQNIKNAKYLQLSYLYKLFISYLIIVIICVGFMAVFSYRLESNNIKNWAIKSNNDLLNHFKHTIDSFILDNVDKISLIVLQNAINNPDISYYFLNSIEGNYTGLLKVSDFLKNIKAANPLINSITIYYKNNELLVSTDGIKYNPDDNSIMPDRLYIYELYDSDIKEYWGLKKERSTLAPSVNSSTDTEKVFITYVRKISSPSAKSKAGGSIAIAVDESILHSLIKGSAPVNFGQIFVINEDGEILSHSDKKYLFSNIRDLSFGNKVWNSCNNNDNGYFIAKVAGKDCIISYISSDYNKWKYITVQPIAELIETKFNFLGKTIILITVVTLIFGLFVSLISTKSIYSPLKYLSELCKNIIQTRFVNIPKDECRIISSTLGLLSSKVKEQEKKLEKSIPIIKHHFIQSLLKSDSLNEEDIYEKMEFLGVTFPFEYFIAMTLKLRKYPNSIGLKTLEMVKLDIMEKAEQILSDYNLKSICTEGIDSINIILNLNNKDIDIIPYAMKLVDYINNSLNLQVNISIGNSYSGLDNIRTSFTEAEMYVNYSYIYPEKNIFTVKEGINWELNSGEVLRTIYEEFYNSMKMRDKKASLESIKNIIGTIRKEHMCYNYSIRTLLQCVTCIEDTVAELKINPDYITSNDIYTDFNNIDNILDLKKWFEVIITQIFEYFEEMRSEKNSDFIKEVKDFISENILNPSISLNYVAEAMHISPTYLSRMFKQETGMNFVEYLMEEKLNAAKELLLVNKNIKIEDVCAAVGYSSPQYFIRKFKLKYGTTPGEYRVSYLRDVRNSKT
ncbi:MAG: helix-turn-helix domain-containing protein [Firmicutes bacterium]|nr:helix-turn-helix domain-containing protein [Bacillota bacterium]